MRKPLYERRKNQKYPGYSCDYGGYCKRQPYVEVYPGNGSWSYLCFWHFVYARITIYKIKIMKRRLGWCYVKDGVDNDE
jgi:hypothetical protein